MKSTQDEKAPPTCEECKNWKDAKRKVRITRLLQRAMLQLETKIETSDLKPTVGEYLKLLQLEQEFEQESPKEIKVTWVQPEEMSVGEK